jgi:hypothetical protein
MLKIRKNIAISDSGFVFDPLSGESFSLNQIAMEIIEFIKKGNGFEAVSQHILEKYEVDAETFERYYYDFIATLKQFNLTEQEGND